eukprot:GHVR01097024.1.p3 GENE.GHVR01097024.1~~GHVR01097024.1.p3  ORF type:complete len:121 (-),score=13.83 GHVR01097024.1:1514-1876(-)
MAQVARMFPERGRRIAIRQQSAAAITLKESEVPARCSDVPFAGELQVSHGPSVISGAAVPVEERDAEPVTTGCISARTRLLKQIGRTRLISWSFRAGLEGLGCQSAARWVAFFASRDALG